MNNFCSQCGSRVTDQNDRFCSNCGHKFDQYQSLETTPARTVFSIEKVTSMFLQANPSGADLKTANKMLQVCLDFARNSSGWDQIGDAGLDEYTQDLFHKIYEAYPRAWAIWDSEYMADQVLREFKRKRKLGSS